MAIIEVSKQITNYLDSEQTASAPANPVEGQRWTDTSKSPPVAMIYTEGDWKPERLSVEVLDPDFYQDLEDTKTEVATAIEKAEAAEKAGKDAQAAGEAAQQAAEDAKQVGEAAKVAGAEARAAAEDAGIAAEQAKVVGEAAQLAANDAKQAGDTAIALANQADIDAKAAKAKADAIQIDVNGVMSDVASINANVTAINTKANDAYAKANAVEGRTSTLETAVTGLTGRLTDVESTSTSTTKKLNELIVTVDGQKQTIATVTTTADSALNKANALETTVDGVTRTISSVQTELGTKLTDKSYSTSSSADVNVRKWTLIAKTKLTARYQDIRVGIDFMGSGATNSKTVLGRIYLNHKQQAAMGQNSVFEISISDTSLVTASDLAAIEVTTTESLSEVWYYMKWSQTYTAFRMTPFGKAGVGQVEYMSMQPFITDLPAYNKISNGVETGVLLGNTETVTKVNQVSETVDGHTQLIASTKTTADSALTKATQVETTVNGLKTTVSSVETTANSALTKATQVDQTAAGILQTVSQISSTGSNMVTNSSFENDFIGWGNSTRHSIDTTSANVHTGSKALKIAAGSGITSIAPSSNTFPVIPGRKYEISYWYKTTSDANGTADNQKLRLANSAGSILESLAWSGTQTEWTRNSAIYTAGTNIYEWRFSIIANHTVGTVWWDDISILDVTDQVTLSSQITQLSDAINLKVSKNDVVNQINLSTEGILIAGNKIQIIGSTYISDAVIKTAHIVDLAVSTAKISDLAVNEGKIGNLAVTNAKIANLSVTEGKIGDAAITNAKIGNLAVSEAKIASLAVSEGKIANLAVTEGKIGNLAVTTAKIADLAVNNAKIASLDAAKINTGYLAAARIAASSITTDKLNVATLSAITADLGNVTAGTITGLEIIGGSYTQSATMTDPNSGKSGISEIKIASGVLTNSFNSTDSSVSRQTTLSSGVLRFLNLGSEFGRLQSNSDKGSSTVPALEISGTFVAITSSQRGWINLSANGVFEGNTYNGYSVDAASNTGNYIGFNRNSSDKMNFFVGKTADGTKRMGSDDLYATSGSGKALHITSGGSIVAYSSSERFKEYIETAADVNPKSLLNLELKSWIYKSSHSLVSVGEPIRRVYGLIAEDVERVGLNQYVERDINGRVEGYKPELWTVTIPILKEHEESIETLKQKVKKLEEKIEALQAA